MAAPVGVRAGVGDAGHAGQFLLVDRAIDRFADRELGPLANVSASRNSFHIVPRKTRCLDCPRYSCVI